MKNQIIFSLGIVCAIQTFFIIYLSNTFIYEPKVKICNHTNKNIEQIQINNEIGFDNIEASQCSDYKKISKKNNGIKLTIIQTDNGIVKFSHLNPFDGHKQQIKNGKNIIHIKSFTENEYFFKEYYRSIDFSLE